ncbi:MAG: L,D-transpeptidase [Chloroflexi bacterium]|nr:L,D-transpeptidase [Chloroflexota bacterium]
MELRFSRRDFLKVSSAGLLGLFLAELRLDRAFAAETPKQGRMTLSGGELFNEPFFNAKKIHTFGRDEIVEITGESEGDQGYGNPFNAIWYVINNEGYIYSGAVQPVDTLHQKPVFDIPEAGVLGEITVPFCDTRLDMSILAGRGYRVYYSSTHWITDVAVNRNEKSIWYKIYDRQIQESFFVPAHEMRLISPSELSLLSPEVPEENKYIYVDLATQTVTAFEDEKPVLVTRCSSGAKGTRTPLGEFRTFHKGSSIHMTNQGDAVGHIYDLPGVPWVSFFTGNGVALHGTYWHNDYGRPRSRGCVNLTPGDAKFIYRWTRPEVPPETQYLYKPGEGTLVKVVLTTS